MNRKEAKAIFDDPKSTPEQKAEAVEFLGESPERTLDTAVQSYQEKEAAASPAQKAKGKKSKFAFKSKKVAIVAESVALEQIELLFDRYRIDIEEMMEDDLEYAESIESAAKVVLKAIMFGEVNIYEDPNDSNKIKVKQHIQHKSSKNTISNIIYGELEGNDNSSMPDKKGTNNHDKMYALLGSMNEDVAGENTIRKLRASDIKTAHALSNLFLVP